MWYVSYRWQVITKAMQESGKVDGDSWSDM